MSEYNITLTGKLQRFIGGDGDTWYLDDTQVTFASKDQAIATPINVGIALSVNDKNEVYSGDGYYVLT